MGSIETAETRAESPRASCRYCSNTNMKPKKAKNWTKIDSCRPPGHGG